MRERKNMMIGELIRKEPYSSILYIIYFYNYIKNKKVRFEHLKNVLINKETLFSVFNEEFELYHVSWNLITEYINGKFPQNNLTNFLKRLENENLIKKYKTKKERYPFYRITSFGLKIIERHFYRTLIETCEEKEFSKIKTNILHILEMDKQIEKDNI